MSNLRKYSILLIVTFVTISFLDLSAQDKLISFGKSGSLEKALFKTKEKEQTLLWKNVNTDPDTWHVEKDLLICTGKPIGVMRSEKQYENFVLHIEWMHNC